MNLTEKIISSHLIRGEAKEGNEIALGIDQTLTQDALGMLAYIAFESFGIPQVRTQCSVSYLDHNMVYLDHRNPDDHAYLISMGKKYGIRVSRPGNGICHLVHCGRFALPGRTLLGTDSHTPTSGALGMLALGAGGIDVAAAMAGEPFYLKMPRVVNVRLTGSFKPGVGAKDLALAIAGRFTVKGGTGCVLEYTGPALGHLTVPQRMTLANMGAETGATSSIFPSDEQTRIYLKAQGREADFLPLAADPGAEYGQVVEFDLGEVDFMAAKPSQPDRVTPIRELRGIPVNQVYIGSCTNSSYSDLKTAARILRGRMVPDHVSLVVSPGARQNYQMMMEEGILSDFVLAGARILECGCGPCVGMGQAVQSGGVSVRTSNRNFKGRCGTTAASVYLAGPAVAAAAAVTGFLCPPGEVISLEELAGIGEPEAYFVDDAMIALPAGPEARDQVEVVRGPSIRPIPLGTPQPGEIRARVVKKLGDNVSTDEIAPTGPEYGALRSNVPEAAKTAFIRSDPGFYGRALEYGSSVILAGENYGQGSSREHAALLPAYLGVRAVIARSFARIHRTNLINFGVLPLVFAEGSGPELAEEGQELVIQKKICAGETSDSWYTITAGATGKTFEAVASLTEREREIYAAGGLLSFIKGKY